MKLKQKPEDFIVREIISLPLSKEGPYSYYLLRKRLSTTQFAVSFISKKFRIKPNLINFAGTKDKDAVTEQYISIRQGPQKNLSSGDKRISLEFIGSGRDRINLGTHEGNEFEIIIRDISKPPKYVQCFPNYFDSQRFGPNLNNVKAGKLILQGKYKQACSLIPETKDSLKKNPNNYLAALKSVPKQTLRFYPHAVQSYVWNLAASRILSQYPHKTLKTPIGELIFPKTVKGNLSLPIPGHSTKSSSLPKEMKNILKQQSLTLQSFDQPRFPELNLEGSERDLIVYPANLLIRDLQKDNLNPKKKKSRVTFFLPKGSYATMLIKSLFL